MLSRTNDNFGYRNPARVSQRTAQQDIRFVPSLLDLEIVRLIEEERIDLINFDEVDDVHRLDCFDVDSGKIFFL